MSHEVHMEGQLNLNDVSSDRRSRSETPVHRRRQRPTWAKPPQGNKPVQERAPMPEGLPEGGGPKFRAFFSPLLPQFSFWQGGTRDRGVHPVVRRFAIALRSRGTTTSRCSPYSSARCSWKDVVSLCATPMHDASAVRCHRAVRARSGRLQTRALPTERTLCAAKLEPTDLKLRDMDISVRARDEAHPARCPVVFRHLHITLRSAFTATLEQYPNCATTNGAVFQFVVHCRVR